MLIQSLTFAAGKTAEISRITALIGASNSGKSEALRDIFRLAFEHLDAGVSVIDADLRLIAFNQRFLEIFDIPPDTLRPGDGYEAFLRGQLEKVGPL